MARIYGVQVSCRPDRRDCQPDGKGVRCEVESEESRRQSTERNALHFLVCRGARREDASVAAGSDGAPVKTCDQCQWSD